MAGDGGDHARDYPLTRQHLHPLANGKSIAKPCAAQPCLSAGKPKKTSCINSSHQIGQLVGVSRHQHARTACANMGVEIANLASLDGESFAPPKRLDVLEYVFF